MKSIARRQSEKGIKQNRRRKQSKKKVLAKRTMKHVPKEKNDENINASVCAAVENTPRYMAKSAKQLASAMANLGEKSRKNMFDYYSLKAIPGEK